MTGEFERLRRDAQALLEAVDTTAAATRAAADAIEGRARDAEAAARRAIAVVFLLATAALIGAGVAPHPRHPRLRSVSYSAERIASGDLRHLVEVTSRDELGDLQAAMRAMSGRLGEVIGDVLAAEPPPLLPSRVRWPAPSQQLLQGTGEQASSVEETSALLEEMNALSPATPRAAGRSRRWRARAPRTRSAAARPWTRR